MAVIRKTTHLQTHKHMSYFVLNNSISLIHNNGRIVVQGTNPDYDPTSNTTDTGVILQLDGGQGVTEINTQAGGHRQVSWTARRGAPVITLTSAADDPVTLQTQDGRGTVAFTAEGSGLTSQWGPFATAAFSLAVVMRLDRTVTTYGTIPGMGGTLTVLTSQHMSVTVPAGGGGAVPLDAVFLDCWHVLTVRNDTHSRVVSIDDKPVLITAPSTGVVGVLESVVLAAGFPGEIGELVVWNGALNPSDMSSFVGMLRQKWNIFGLPSVPRYTIPNTTGTVWPTDVPAPTVWLDAACPGTLFADTAATIPAVPHGRVGRWLDRSGNGNHVTFNDTGPTCWATGGAEVIAGLPVVSVSGTDPGTFTKGNPLVGATGGVFMVIAVWRMTGSGGHPFCVNGHGTFTSTVWVDGLATDSYRNMPAPNTLTPFPVGPRDNVLVVWERSAAPMTLVRVYNIGDSDVSGSVYSESGDTDHLWLGETVTVGFTNQGLQLAELLVWSGSTPSVPSRTELRSYVVDRWGITLLPHAAAGQVTIATLPAPVPTGIMVRYLRLSRPVGNNYMNEIGLEAYKGTHATACLNTLLCVLCGQHKHVFGYKDGSP